MARQVLYYQHLIEVLKVFLDVNFVGMKKNCRAVAVFKIKTACNLRIFQPELFNFVTKSPYIQSKFFGCMCTVAVTGI